MLKVKQLCYENIMKSKEFLEIRNRQEMLGIDPSLIIMTQESLAAIHYALSKRQNDGELLIPQKAFIESCKKNHFMGAERWLDDMFCEMKKANDLNGLEDTVAAAKYLKQAEPLASPHLLGKMQSPSWDSPQR